MLNMNPVFQGFSVTLVLLSSAVLGASAHAAPAAKAKTRYACVLAYQSESGTYGLDVDGTLSATLIGEGSRQHLKLEYIEASTADRELVVDDAPIDLKYQPRKRIGWKRFDGETGRDCALYYLIDGSMARRAAAGVLRAECSGQDYFAEQYFCRRQK